MGSPQLLTEAEAAELLHVSPFTVARLRKRGELGHRKIGGQIRYSPIDVQKYIDQCAQTPTSNSSKSPAAPIGTFTGRKTEGLDAAQRGRQIAEKLMRF